MENRHESFIALLGQKKAAVKDDRDILANVLKSIQSILERYYDSESTFVKQAIILNQYAGLLQRTKKDHVPMQPRCSTKEIAEDTTSLINSVIEEVQTIGLPQPASKTVSGDITINNTQNQTKNQEQRQSQQQDVIIKILLEAAKDELTGKQRKELLAIAEETLNPQEARKSIFAKLKDFGEDVAANIVANIMTNPQVWQNIESLL